MRPRVLQNSRIALPAIEAELFDFFWFGIVAPAGTPKPIVDRLSSKTG